MKMTKDKVFSTIGEVQPLLVFSVDGCRTAEHTLNDLLLAEQMTGSGAIILIDNYYNLNLPSVQEGIAKYFSTQPVRQVLLCSAFSKLLLVDSVYHDRFMKKLVLRLRSVNQCPAKKVKRYGLENFSALRKRQ
jgi:hypothetical protein